MTRANFGGTVADFVFETTAARLIRAAAGTLTMWTAAIGGTHITDLILDGDPVTAIPVAKDGQVPQFQGPDGTYTMWAESGGTRVLLTASIDITERAEAARTGAEAAQAAAEAVGTTNDAVIAGRISTPGSATDLALQAAIAAATIPPDKGETFVTNLDQKVSGTRVWLHIDDSTGVGPLGPYTTNSHVRRVCQDLVAKYPTLRLEYYEATPQPTPTTYTSAEVLGTGITTSTVLADTFAATVANIYGRQADVGGVWNDNSGGVTIRYALSGDGSATQSSNGTTWLTGTKPGYMDTIINITKLMTSGNVSLFSSYISTSNFLQLRMNSNSTIEFITQINNTTTTVSSSTPTAAGLATTGTLTFPLRIRHKTNGDVEFYVNGVLLYTHTLAGGDSALFATASRAGMAGSTAGHKILDITADATTTATGTLKVYNGSAQSKTADWSLANLTTLLGGQVPNLTTIGHGHNHGTETPSTFEGKLEALIAGVRAAAPSSAIGILSQNPEFSPATNYVAHNLREADKRRYARVNDYLYLPGFEAYMSQGNPSAYVRPTDGVHPNDTPLPDGFALTRAAVMDILEALSLQPA